MARLSIDIGAESGRALLGAISEGRLVTREVHRFANRPIQVDGSLRWDIDSLERDVRIGIGSSGGVDSVAIDTWGVDFVLLDRNDRPLERPFHHRDRRTEGVMERAFKTLPKERIYERTAIQYMPFNTLYQLIATSQAKLDQAKTFLTIPDYLAHRISNGADLCCEFTNATTTQCFDPVARNWAFDVMKAFELPPQIFPPIVPPGSLLSIVAGTEIRVPASHDTASAIAAVPSEDAGCAWISSGTWSIMGIDVPQPVLTSKAMEANLTNEGAADGGFRLCKNVMGLWLVQQCRAAWSEDYSYEELSEMAAHAEPNFASLDVDAPEFLAPGDMPARIAAKLAADGQRLPGTPGQLVRVILEGLAMKYAKVLQLLREVSGRRIDRLHIVGGGSQNGLLNQLTADACQIPVLAGPVEATAIGNLLVQFVAAGEIESLDAGRRIVRQSYPLEQFEARI